MNETLQVRCRMVACRDDGHNWSFHLLNDNDFALEEVVLHEVCYEWGDFGNSEIADVHIAGLGSGAHARIWMDDGSGAELRMELCVRIRSAHLMVDLSFEFPKLYRKKDLPSVKGLDRPGWEVLGEIRRH